MYKSSVGSTPSSPAPRDTPSYFRFWKAEFPDGVGTEYSKSSSINSGTTLSVLAARVTKQSDRSANFLCVDYLNANTLLIGYCTEGIL